MTVEENHAILVYIAIQGLIELPLIAKYYFLQNAQAIYDLNQYRQI